ncbi:putative lipoyltransferase 2, mitochondrial [Rhizophlyctis rosea]|uniref:lipoyl(octanoyl) transferase n=1 Tax=Rhizophlyctis rosea TaxID=64517 RepID=A0AAD5SES0_9FUNG|nr:putative lipoyltransferase 2, mitochondrial [Rhizophlyctis rosea]
MGPYQRRFQSLVSRLRQTCHNARSAKNEVRWMIESILLRRIQTPFPRQPPPPPPNFSITKAHVEPTLASSTQKCLERLANNQTDKSVVGALGALSEKELGRLEAWVSQRTEEHKPLQYILGTQPFAGLEFKVRRPTLIPRWETEEWIFKIIESYKSHYTTHPVTRPLRILDLCTGSGCIALTVAHHLNQNRTTPLAHITAVDFSERALSLSLVNQRRSGIPANHVSFHQGDITSDTFMRSLSTDGPYDLIVSNPPYIPPDEYAKLDKSVTDWEDRAALFADGDGLGFHRVIAKHAREHLLRRDGDRDPDLPILVMEIGEGQAEGAKRVLVDAGFENVSARKDLAGVERIVSARGLSEIEAKTSSPKKAAPAVVPPTPSTITPHSNQAAIVNSSSKPRPPIAYKYLGPSVPYMQALSLQDLLVNKAASSPDSSTNVLLLLQHPPTYTAGRRVKGTEDTEGARLRALGAEYHEVKRGGQTTFHGPGQLIGYPILNLLHYQLDVRSYVQHLERSLIRTCEHFGIRAQTTADTGVWIEDRKIAALGIHVRRHITNHGFALNCDVDLTWFDHIVACGLPDKKATSLGVEALSGGRITVDDAIPSLLRSFEEIFETQVDRLGKISPSLDDEIEQWIRKDQTG